MCNLVHCRVTNQNTNINKVSSATLTQSPPLHCLNAQIHEGNGDSGASGHYMPSSAIHLLRDVCEATEPVHVKCANDAIIKSTHTAVLDMPHIPAAARKCHLFKEISIINRPILRPRYDCVLRRLHNRNSRQTFQSTSHTWSQKL